MVSDIRIAMLFLVGFSIAGSLFVFITDDAEGAVIVSIFNETTDTDPAQRTVWDGTHMKDDVLAISYVSSDDKLMVAHKESGGSWEYDIVDDTGTAYLVGAILNTANNTLVIQSTVVHTTYLECRIFIKWPSSDWDDWYDLLIMSGGVHYLPGDLALNDEGLIGILSGRSGSPNLMKWAEVNLSDPITIVSGSGGSQSVGAGHTTDAYETMQMFANVTGEWFFFWRSGSQHYMYGNDTGYEIISASMTYLNHIALLENGIFIGVGQASQTGYLTFYYQPTVSHEGYWQNRVMSESPHTLFASNAARISTYQNSTWVTVISYCDTHGEIIKWGQQWDATSLQWKASMADTGITDADDISMKGSFGRIRPVHPTTGIRWTLPKSGWIVIGRNESGATDSLVLVSDTVTWTADLTTEDPEITTTELPDAEYDVFYSYTLERANGTIPHVWTLLIAPAWMSIGSVNGTIYGTPDGTGTEQVRVKLADAVPRYDEVQWTLSIGTGDEGGDEGFDPSVAWALWWGDPGCISAFMVISVIVLMAFIIIRSRM